MASDQKWTKSNDNGPLPECPQYNATDKTFERAGAAAIEDASHKVVVNARNSPTEFTRKAPWWIRMGL